jgi:ABC-type multidrug transport system fused ATPase/permease subunit
VPDNSDSAETAQDSAESALEAIREIEKQLGEYLTLAERRHSRHRFLFGVAALVVFFLSMHITFFNTSYQTATLNPLTLSYILFATVATCAWAAYIYKIGTHLASDIFLAVGLSLVNIVTWFTFAYHSVGTDSNFSGKLTHLDAVYFTLGTLTTAGTGSLAPASPLSRGLVSVQMIVDLIFIAGTVVIATQKILAMQKNPLPKHSAVNRWRKNAQQALTQLQSARQKLEQLTAAADPKSTAEIKTALREAKSAALTVVSDHQRLWGHKPDQTSGTAGAATRPGDR